MSQVSDAVAREKCTYWTHKNSQLAALVSWGEIDRFTYLFGLEGFFCVIGVFFSLKNVSHITVQEVEFIYF